MSSASHASSLTIKSIAAACALGTGMVAVATVLSAPGGFLLIMIASIVLNYGSVFFHHWFNHFWGQKTFSGNLKNNYIDKVLRNKAPLNQLSPDHAGRLAPKESLSIALSSLVAAALLAAFAYYVFLAFIPSVVLLYSVAAMLFFPIVFVVYRAFRRGLEDVWHGLSQPDSVQSESKLNSPGWVLAKRAIMGFGVLSCIAGGFLGSALVQEGVATTAGQVFAWLGSGLTVLTGPIGWFMFALLFVSVTAIMARSVMMFVHDESLEEKIKLKHALFNNADYLVDLQNDWQKINLEIETTLEAYKTNQASSELAEKLDKLFALKDTVYHRYSLFSKPWFQPLFTGVTILLSAFCLLGMLAHMARGAHSGIELLSDVTGLSEKIAGSIATGIIAIGLMAETLFTVTNVGDSMLEEGIGTQTNLYERDLQSQETSGQTVSRFAYGSSRIQHSFFDWGLVANGAGGHASGSTGYAFADKLGMVGELGAAARAAAERDPAPVFYQWQYGSAHKALLEPLHEKPDLPAPPI
jgi:ABC-type multidrug transport system fused ATPase/permease subunit